MEPQELLVIEHVLVGIQSADDGELIGALAVEDAQRQFRGHLTLPITTDQFSAHNPIPQIDIPK